MPSFDLAFRILGMTLSVDHGYALYSSINRIIPDIHDAKEVGVHPIRGTYSGNGSLHLTEQSRLIFRVPDDWIRPLLKLAGKKLDVGGHSIQVGVCETRALRPAATLYSRLVTIKGFMEPKPFLEACGRQLQENGITAKLDLGERRTLRVKEKQVVGFEMIATELTAEDSIYLQEVGIGGRRRMGCGVFVPHKDL